MRAVRVSVRRNHNTPRVTHRVQVERRAKPRANSVNQVFHLTISEHLLRGRLQRVNALTAHTQQSTIQGAGALQARHSRITLTHHQERRRTSTRPLGFHELRRESRFRDLRGRERRVHLLLRAQPGASRLQHALTHRRDVLVAAHRPFFQRAAHHLRQGVRHGARTIQLVFRLVRIGCPRHPHAHHGDETVRHILIRHVRVFDTQTLFHGPQALVDRCRQRFLERHIMLTTQASEHGVTERFHMLAWRVAPREPQVRRHGNFTLTRSHRNATRIIPRSQGRRFQPHGTGRGHVERVCRELTRCRVL